MWNRWYSSVEYIKKASVIITDRSIMIGPCTTSEGAVCIDFTTKEYKWK